MKYIKTFETVNHYLVYHGSDSENITEFDLNRIGKRVSKLGFFFTSDKDFAEMFGENVSAHLLTLNNPFIIDQMEWYDWRDIKNGDAWFVNKRNSLIKKGYDSIIAQKEDGMSDTIIAFYPKQISNV